LRRLLLLVLLVSACAPVDRATHPQRLVGAGDIASCGEQWDTYTGRLIATLPGRAFAAGDMEYDGHWRCWTDSWGGETPRMYPSVGNHENRAAYLDYWRDRGMRPRHGTSERYWFDVGAARVFMLNSQYDIAESAAFLREHSDDRLCEVAIWHHPYVSDGQLGQLPATDPRHDDIGKVRPLWEAAYDIGVDLVINGHDHNYQRFTKLDRAGRFVGPGYRGVREIVVGTGGRHLNRYFPKGLHQGSRAYDSNSYGVLEVKLHRADDPGEIGFEFHPADTPDPRDSMFRDEGVFTCGR